MEIFNLFSDIYKNKTWGEHTPEFMNSRKNKKFYSGGGSNIDNDGGGVYKSLLQDLLNREDIKTVVEIGCGDWEFNSHFDWSNVQYIGYDVVKDLIKYNNNNFSNKNIKFIHGDGFNMDLSADLIIIKDVIQHLPPSYTKDFVRSIPVKFKENLITNDTGSNSEIPISGYNGNDFGSEPFSMHYESLITWSQVNPQAGNKQTIKLISTR